ncbi:MAG: polyphosphate kinase 1, partial [Caldithrix sp.]|nr:polyphosphate kinase 1 [Caldithrix sp.]
VRVGSLKRMVQAGVKARSAIGGSPNKILEEIHSIVLKQRKDFDATFEQVVDELENEGIYIINENNLDTEQSEFVDDYFEMEVRPRLVPIMIDSLPEFPYLKNQIIYLAIRLSKKFEPEDKKFALIEIPVDVLPRFIVLPQKDENIYIIMLDDVIRCGLKDIFNIFDYDQIDAYTIKLTRDAEIDIKDDVTKSFFEKISKSIKQRQTGQPVRFVYDAHMPKDLLDLILERNHLQSFENIIPGGRYHNARDFINFPTVGRKSLRYEDVEPIETTEIERHVSILEAIRQQDILLHFPYQSFRYITDLLREAAIDPEVTSIQMTLYRVAKNSNVINTLINAVKNGKTVKVVMELQARFDEEANIYWTQQLREVGAHVIDGVPGLKVHAKLCLITRKTGEHQVTYVASIGTGNYNESTAKLYSDHNLLTADQRITREVKRVFDFFETNYKVGTYNHLVVAPFYMRQKFYKLINNEIKNAQSGEKAYIQIKINSLVDRSMINKLYQASQKGVKIKIIARSICSLVPGIPGISDNIEAISIVDKYLEHSRIFIFANKGRPLYFISSADWMIRNLDNRVEVATPIYSPKIKKQLKAFFNFQLKDNIKARSLRDQRKNAMIKPDGKPRVRAQFDFHRYLQDYFKEKDK